ncbi:MAG: DoxX family protein [Candidatus Sulfotelmatobacter sp.]
MHTSKNYALALGRVLLSSVFIWQGILQLADPGASVKYFASVHVPYPDIAIWLSILINLGAGLALLVGFATHWVAGVLAVLCLYTAFGVHLRVGDLANMFNFYKNITIAGGLMYVMVFGPGSISVDEAMGTD